MLARVNDVQSYVSIGKGSRIHLVQSPHFIDEGAESLMFITNKDPEKSGQNMWYLSAMRKDDGKRTLMFIIFRRYSLLES